MPSDKLDQLHEFEINEFAFNYCEFFDRALRVRRSFENHRKLDAVFEYELDDMPFYVQDLTDDCIFLKGLEFGMGLREVPETRHMLSHASLPDAGDLDGWLKASDTTLPYAGPGFTRASGAYEAMERSLSDPSSDLTPHERHLGMSLLDLWYLVDEVTESKDVGLLMDWILQTPRKVEAVRVDIQKINAIDESAPERSWVMGFIAVRKVLDVMTANVEKASDIRRDDAN